MSSLLHKIKPKKALVLLPPIIASSCAAPSALNAQTGQAINSPASNGLRKEGKESSGAA